MAEPVADLFVRVKATFDELKKVGSQVEAALAPARQRLRGVGTALSASITLPLLAIGKQALDTAARFDTLERGLVAMTGSSEEAAKQLKRLREIAKAPGLSFEQAVDGSVNLQAIGFDAQFAERTLSAVGNALTLVGRGADDLKGVNLALTQIVSKGKVSAEEINQIAERMPQIRAAIKEAFGTASSEDIQKLGLTAEQFIEGVVGELEKLPKATSGIANDLENLKQSFTLAFAEIGKALIPVVQAITDQLTPVIEALAKKFGELPSQTKTLIVAFAGIAAAAGPIALALSAVLTPMAAVVAGIGLVAAAGFTLVKDWDVIKSQLIAIYEAIKLKLLAVVQDMILGLQIIRSITPGFSGLFLNAAAGIDIATAAINKLVGKGIDGYTSAVDAASKKTTTFGKILGDLKGVVSQVENALPSVSSGSLFSFQRPNVLGDGLRKARGAEIEQNRLNVLQGDPGLLPLDLPDLEQIFPRDSVAALQERLGQVTKSFNESSGAARDALIPELLAIKTRLGEISETAQLVTDQFSITGELGLLAFDAIGASIDQMASKLFEAGNGIKKISDLGKTLRESIGGALRAILTELTAVVAKTLVLKGILALLGVSGGGSSLGGIFSTLLGGGNIAGLFGGGSSIPVGGGPSFAAGSPVPIFKVQNAVTTNGFVQTINEQAAFSTSRDFGG